MYWYEGFLYVSCAGDSTLYRLDDRTGITQTYIFGLQNAHSLYVEPGRGDDPVIWAVDSIQNRLVRISYDAEGLQTVWGGLQGGWGLLPDAGGEGFYLSQWGSDDILFIDREGGGAEILAAGFQNPAGMALEDDYLYVANNGSSARAIEWLDLSAESPRARLLVKDLQNVTNLVMAADGYLYMAYALAGRGIISRVKPEACREEACGNDDLELVIWTELSAPLAGLTISPDLQLFVHVMFGPEIYTLNLSSPE
jgi:sugar lactone lactonase YvrE